MRGIESKVVYPAPISFGLIAMKACSPFLRSVAHPQWSPSSRRGGWSLLTPVAGPGGAHRLRPTYLPPAFFLVLFTVYMIRLCELRYPYKDREGSLDGFSKGWVTCGCILAFHSHYKRVAFFESHVTLFPSADTSMVCALLHSSLCFMWTRCLVVIIACANSKFVADAIRSGWNGSQLTFIPSVLVRWHANAKEF